MGFIEETGIAQHMRDARVLAIYEGTNGIQANDLVFRKLARDGGAAFNELTKEMEDFLIELGQQRGEDCEAIHNHLKTAVESLTISGGWILRKAR